MKDDLNEFDRKEKQRLKWLYFLVFFNFAFMYWGNAFWRWSFAILGLGIIIWTVLNLTGNKERVSARQFSTNNLWHSLNLALSPFTVMFIFGLDNFEIKNWPPVFFINYLFLVIYSLYLPYDVIKFWTFGNKDFNKI